MATTKRGLWESVYYAIINSRTLTVKTVTYLPHERAHIDTILGAFLDAAGMRPLKNKLSYCIHELAGDAKKANTKRLFFREKNLEIGSEKDYSTAWRSSSTRCSSVSTTTSTGCARRTST